MMIEEAIKHCEEVAEEQEQKAKDKRRLEDNMVELYHSCGGQGSADYREAEACAECASEHRQLAEWLRELKAYRKAEKEIEQELVNWDDIDNGKCRGLFLATSIIQHYKSGEVNADD